MKTIKVFSLIPALLLIGCATTHHQEKSVTQEAMLESPTQSSAETKAKLLEILDQDPSVSADEKKQVMAIVEDSFSRYNALETLSNQKKSLLIREFISENPQSSKLRLIKNSIKKVYQDRADLLLETFQKISKVIKPHPDSAELYFKRADSMWPFRDRAH